MRLNDINFTLIVNGKKLITLKTKAVNEPIKKAYQYLTLNGAYTRPSTRKKEIFEECEKIKNELYLNDNVFIFNSGISDYNTDQFTYIIDLEIYGHIFRIKRTKAKDYIIGIKNNIKWLLDFINDDNTLII